MSWFIRHLIVAEFHLGRERNSKQEDLWNITKSVPGCWQRSVRIDLCLKRLRMTHPEQSREQTSYLPQHSSSSPLLFVRRSVPYCGAVALRVPLPSFGVSSLDLGRLLHAGGPFSRLGNYAAAQQLFSNNAVVINVRPASRWSTSS